MGKKLSLILSTAAISCGLLSQAFAGMEDSSEQATMRTGSDTTGFRDITPNAGPRVTNGIDVFITADFIWWTGRQDGLAFARSGLADYSEAVAFGPSQCGQTYYPKFKFSPGFKVGAGLNLGHDGWDTYLNFTWFHTSTKTRTISSTNSLTAPVPLWETATLGTVTAQQNFLVLSTFVNAGKTSANWKLRFNNFDWELARNFYVSQYLALRPYAGLKGNWMKQYFHTSASNYLNSEISSEVSKAIMNQEQKFWGVGIRTGMDSTWCFDKNWSAFANTALSSLWGRFYTLRNDSVVLVGTTLERGVINTKEDFHTVRPVLELQLGARYDYWFCDDDYHLGVEVAWEQQVWFNQNQFIDYLSPPVNDAALILQGLTIDFRFDF